MDEGVKARRYDNSRRETRARATRSDIVAAAQELFVARGYSATTVEAIADAAGTAPATVYRLFGSKRGVLTEALDLAFGGDDEPIAFGDRPEVRAVFDESDPRLFLTGFARVARALMDRSAPIQHVLREAAAVEPDAAEVLTLVNAQRLEGQSRIAHVLATRGLLADGISERDAADTIYAVMSPQIHRILTVERGWSSRRYERWLAHSLGSILLAQ